MGWFGFNAGSALARRRSGHQRLRGDALRGGSRQRWAGWLAEWIKHGKPSVLGGISGCVAGLVAITPAPASSKPLPALLIGFLAGWSAISWSPFVKNKFGYDDSLDAFGVHGAGGTLGRTSRPAFSRPTRSTMRLKDPRASLLPLGLVDGHARRVLNQAIGCGIAWGLAIVGTLIILKICDMTIGLRVSPEQEQEGLDFLVDGEQG